jgi:hypothetical protein
VKGLGGGGGGGGKGVEPLSPETYPTPVNIRNKNNRRSSRARGERPFQVHKVKLSSAGEIIASGVKGGKKQKVVVGLPPCKARVANQVRKGDKKSNKTIYAGEIMVDETAL